MSKNQTFVKSVDCQTVSETVYDAVIVGSGVAGAIVAKQLSEQGKRILIIEATPSKDLSIAGFQSYVDHFYSATAKDANSPYPSNPNALSPNNIDDYFQELGPMKLGGSYTRITGGTTMHWEAKTPRMLPEDFQLYSRYGQGLDWPITYEELMPYYRKAEYEIGVCGDVKEQESLGVIFDEGYVFPMEKLPPSYLDEKVREKIDGTKVELAGETLTLGLTTFPQGRNGVPNPNYDRGNVFVPDGVTSEEPIEYGERCQGNANCVPICPVQAKYDARRTLGKAFQTGRVEMLNQSVAFRVETNPENGRVVGIHYKHYEDPDSPQHTTGVAKGSLFVLATNAVENARLMLASELPSTSGLMGCHLMDHPFLLAWGLMPEVTGTMRGPLCTSGIGTFRKGAFRHQQSAFAMDIHNDGWGWATGSPYTEVVDAVDNKNKYGQELRQTLISRISRQLLLAFMCELPADRSNRVTIDPQFKDQLGNYRPVISFNISDYCLKTFAYARYISRLIFQRLGVEDYTHYDKSDPQYFTYAGEGYFYKGGNHFSGTHVMGTTKNNSVVNSKLRSWDHENLYLVGAGSMPSIGSSNTTLTLAALSFLASEEMLKDLETK
ncbi:MULTISPECIES: GMC family oxidoreductase [Pseudanabaena]|uniref:FAD dependent oxidoreductase n=2 Tax=Pseudanabaena TaxID=1152 RepID=L8N621_9CYAN|nr:MULTISPECIES: GMC family oxidoreductase [Pseudanabaena]ELS33673.1 FAD dependent oxidoreductase [Pseudanabaena biceps PCC 7429]MDG3494114.1 GMC family oxidoreductase [Pseudanabaena catenata USMAC16]